MGCNGHYSTIYMQNGLKATRQKKAMPIKSICQGKIPIHVERTKVFLPPAGSKGSQNIRKQTKDDSNMHHSIDVTMILKKKLRYIEKAIRIALFELRKLSTLRYSKLLIAWQMIPIKKLQRRVSTTLP